MSAPLTQDDFLGVFDRVLPADYVAPLKSPGPGFEILQAYAQQGARVSIAAVNLDNGAHILQSFGGVLAVGAVAFSRPAPTVGLAPAVTLQAGSIVTTSVGGRDFVTTQDAAFALGDLGPIIVTVQAAAPGFDWNVPGPNLTAAGEVLPGRIDTIKQLIQLDPGTADRTFIDGSFVVAQTLDTTGGRSPMLDQLGADRGLPRRSGEGDVAYAARIRALPDTVSPGAVVRLLHQLLDPIPARFTFIETFDMHYQTCWDAPSAAIAGTASQYDTAASNLFCFDDPRPSAPFRNRWLGEEDYRGAFIVVVEKIAALHDVGMAYDDTAETPAAHVSPSNGGRRAQSAYDEASTDPAVAAGLEQTGGYDGFDPAKQAVYVGIYNALQQVKAGGVLAIVELEGQ